MSRMRTSVGQSCDSGILQVLGQCRLCDSLHTQKTCNNCELSFYLTGKGSWDADSGTQGHPDQFSDNQSMLAKELLHNLTSLNWKENTWQPHRVL